MADLKPLGSEKLQGMDKIRRILEISKYGETTPRNENINESLGSIEYTTKLSDGFYYGIVKETRGYILKHGVDDVDLTYMDELMERKYYPSYSQALKRLNIIASEVNRNSGYSYGTPLIGEQSEPKKKFILKTPKPSTPPPATDLGAPPAPAADLGVPPAAPAAPPADLGVPPAGDMGMPPAGDMGMPPAGDMGMPPMGGEEGMPPAGDMGMPPMGGEELPPAGDMGMPPMGGEELPPAGDMGMPPMGDEEQMGEEGPVGLKTIQKLTGRLSQKIRSFDKDKGLDSQDIKYVVNSILSAIDLSKLDEDDKEDILDKFDSFEDYGMDSEDLDLEGEDFDTDEIGGEEPLPSTEEMPAPPTFNESKVERVLSKYFKVTENEKPILEEKRKKQFLEEKLKRVRITKEIENLSETNIQYNVSKKLFNENKNVKFVGKTNKENLMFTHNGKQIKVTPYGRII
jgi:hypothetical protein